jgi:hypothetical protein
MKNAKQSVVNFWLDRLVVQLERNARKLLERDKLVVQLERNVLYLKEREDQLAELQLTIQQCMATVAELQQNRGYDVPKTLVCPSDI